MTRRQPKQTALNFNYESLEVRQVLASVVGFAPDYWQSTDLAQVTQIQGTNYLQASNFELYQLSMAAIRNDLQQAPLEFTPAAERALVFSIPNPTGGFDRFHVVEAPIMAPELAAQFPDIKTYRGQGIDDAAATVRLDVTEQGFHAQVLSPNGSYYVDPYYHLNDSIYMSYFKRDFLAVAESFDNEHQDECSSCGCGACSVVSKIDSVYENAKVGSLNQDNVNGLPTTIDPSLYNVYGRIEPFLSAGDQLFVYDLALAATGEYTAFHGGTVNAGQSAIVTAVNRVTGVYEVEVSIRMQLVANNSSIVYTNGGSDPYTNNNGFTMLGQNQSNLDSVIGNANYDIGHVFSTGGGGVAGLGVVGVNGFKAQGVTGSNVPINDPFTIDYVAHEMGHQFGANHTFNGDSGSCAGGNRNGSTAYELGSGSTIMAYAGICGNDNLQSNSDAYFHFISFEEIRSYVSSGPGFNSAVKINTGNAIPTVDAGINYTIPDQTPFFLTASGSDANAGDALTYNWEQRDLGPQRDLNAVDNGSGPLFRSRPATASPTRYFPQLSNVLNNTSTNAEKLPLTNRNLNFRVTIRDNRSGGGGVNNDNMTITVVNSGNGFAMTSQNTATNWTGNSAQSLTWEVSGTNAGAINTPFVDILFSSNGGTSFDTVLASAVSNDGSHNIVVPNIATNQGRIMIRGTGNIFFDINNANIVVTPGPSGFAFESGVISTVTHGWQTINLSQTFGNPVVMAGPASNNGFDPGIVRIRNVTSNSFQIQYNEWNYLNGLHGNEEVSYFVVEAGTHTLSGGATLVAGTSTLTSSWKTITFDSPLSATPAIVATVASANGADDVTTRIRNASTNSFQIRLQEQESFNDLHGTEFFSYIAMTPGTGTSDGMIFEAGVTPRAVTDATYDLNFTQSFSGTPIFLANSNSAFGTDPYVVRQTALTSTTATFYLQEEQSFDTEMTHGTETVGYIALQATGGAPVAPQRTLADAETVTGRSGLSDQRLNPSYWAAVDAAVVTLPAMKQLPIQVQSVVTSGSEVESKLSVARGDSVVPVASQPNSIELGTLVSSRLVDDTVQVDQDGVFSLDQWFAESEFVSVLG